MKAEFKIEKGIPLAPHGNSVRRQSKYPFSDMKVGDSFAVPAEVLSAVRTASIGYSRANGGSKFTIRKSGKAFRCWRIA